MERQIFINEMQARYEVSIGYPKEEFAVGIRKGDKKLRLKINRALKELKKDGTIKKINHKWFGKNFIDWQISIFGLKLTV